MKQERNVLRTVAAGLAAVLVLAGATACQKNGVGERQPSPSSSEPMSVTVQQVQDWMADGEKLAVLDSRGSESWQYAMTKARGSVRVPAYDVEKHLDIIPKDVRIIVYCT